MRREHKKKLTINRRVIVNHLLDLEGILDYLICKQIFTPAIRERIIYDSRVPTDRVRHLLDYLITRNALAYQYFLEALCITGNTHIADILEPDYSASEQCRLVVEREKLPVQPNKQESDELPYPIMCTQSHDIEKNITNSILSRLLKTNHDTMNHGSRSTSSGCSSASLSPVLNRARSSSVTAMRLNSGFSTPNRNSSNLDEDQARPDQVSQDSPQVYRPQTYHLDWSDVNSLELDFTVYKTLPNLRKQLTCNECYQMEQTPRGICLIINNERFYDANGIEILSMRRYGTDMDASRLKNLFEKLNFNVEMFVDLKEAEMRQVIGLLVNKCDSYGHLFDAICFIVLSHGTDGYVYGIDYENKINMDKDILNMFDDVLVGKPKLFIFQACRGEYLNQKYFVSQTNTLSHSITTPVLSTSISTAATTNSYSTSSRSFCGSAINPKQASLEEDTIKKFKQLKMSSLASSSLQMMYKKKSSTTINQHNETKVKKNRSRSHSRSKYSSYLVSAASAIRTAMKTSPSSAKTLLNSISTQTSEVADGYIMNSNILTSSNSMSNFIDGRPIKTSLPSRSDFFIWYSSARGFVSHRDVDGSPFIKCLVTVFSRCAYELELIEMVRKVNLLMQQYEKKHFDERNAIASYFMVPVAEFHLTKRLYFNP